jgi:tetratricopeptide (TPR) repeat protein
MLSLPLPTSTPVDLSAKLGTAGEKEYVQLLWMLRNTQGMFALMPVRSDFSVAARDALLKRLEKDLSSADIPLHVARLTREEWNAAGLIAETASGLQGQGVVVLVGLEETPGIVPVPGERPRRPPAFAVLNHGREAIRRHCPYPLIVWCDPLTYRAMQEHAPDFFDFFTGLFTFLDAAPVRLPAESIFARLAETEPTRLIQPPVIASRAAVAFYEERVEQLREPTPERARALVGLADALRSLHDSDLSARLSRAEAAVREALTLLSPEGNRAEWARGQVILGLILKEMPTGDREENLRQAMACYQAALRVFTETDFPQNWARTQYNLGNAYFSLPTGEREENLRRAITYYQTALRVFTETDFPQEWAATQNSLGAACSHLPRSDGGESLQRAIAYYQAALRVLTEADFPEDWAMTQLNLGTAYAQLPMGDHEENLRQAIACCQAALRVYTEADFPQDWAMTQNNLGVAYHKLPMGDRGGNLRQAIACYQAALRVYTEANFPQDRARTQFNLGLAFEEVGVETGDADAFLTARTYFAAAARGYAVAGSEGDAAEADEMIARIDTALAAGWHARA